MAKQTKQQLIKVNESRHMVITPKVRLSFPQLFTARSFQDDPNQKKEFRADLIFDSEDLLRTKGKSKKGETPSIMQAIQNVKVDQWGKDPKKWPKMEHSPVKDGDEVVNGEGEIYAGYEGKKFIRAKTGEKFPPKVLLADGSPASESDLYGGAIVKAALLVRPYVYGKNSGVSIRLLQIIKVGDGERFGGGVGEDLFEVEEMDEELSEEFETDEDDEF